MLFKTETHLHMAETSSCSSICAREFMERYRAAGYDTVFITDHLRKRFFEEFETPEAAVKRFLLGYYNAKEAGEKLGLTVLMSAELNLGGNDHLLYGITEEFLAQVPLLNDMTPEQLFDVANANGVKIIAAHPFREKRIPNKDLIHGIEVVNGSYNHYHHNNNDKALALAEQMPHLWRTSGSDAHHPMDTGRGGIISKVKIESSEDYINVLKSGDYQLLDAGWPK